MVAYKTGYVAFLDILGIKRYYKSASAEDTKKIFDFIGRVKSVFNGGSGIDVDFFSDSIILMTEKDDFTSFLLPINLIEYYVRTELDLLLRGGITKGEYYHDETNTFGPAIADAYELEENAKYSRIVIDKKIQGYANPFYVFTDLDDARCLNTYSDMLWVDIDADKSYSKDELFDMLLKSLSETNNEITRMCELNIGTEVIDKYMWRIIPFNYMCDFIENRPDEIEYLEDYYSEFTEEEKAKIDSYKLQLSDWFSTLR